MNKKLIVGSALLTLACLTQASIAQDIDRRPPGFDRPHDKREQRPSTPRASTPAQIINRLDQDDDDLISLSEFTANISNSYEKHFSRLDRNDDDSLNAEEFAPRRRGHDHGLDTEEMAACMDENALEPRPDSEARFSAADSDASGALSLEEFYMLLEQGAFDRFDSIDIDADGQLTRSELAQNIAENRSEQRIRRMCMKQTRDSQL